MLAQVTSIGHHPRGSPDFLAYPIPKACQQHGLGTWAPRCLLFAPSTSSAKAAQALGCSLTPGLRVTLGRVTCRARAASVSRLWTQGFSLFWGARVSGLGFAVTPPILAGVYSVCVWVRVLSLPRRSWLEFVVCRSWYGLCVHPAYQRWAVGVLMLVCALLLYPTNRGQVLWCVYLAAGFGFTRPFGAVVSGVCVSVRALLSPRESWLRCWGVFVFLELCL